MRMVWLGFFSFSFYQQKQDGKTGYIFGLFDSHLHWGSNILQSSSRLFSPWTLTFVHQCCLGRTVKALGASNQRDTYAVICRHWMMVMSGLQMSMSWPQFWLAKNGLCRWLLITTGRQLGLPPFACSADDIKDWSPPQHWLEKNKWMVMSD